MSSDHQLCFWGNFVSLLVLLKVQNSTWPDSPYSCLKGASHHPFAVKRDCRLNTCLFCCFCSMKCHLSGQFYIEIVSMGDDFSVPQWRKLSDNLYVFEQYWVKTTAQPLMGFSLLTDMKRWKIPLKVGGDPETFFLSPGQPWVDVRSLWLLLIYCCSHYSTCPRLQDVFTSSHLLFSPATSLGTSFPIPTEFFLTRLSNLSRITFGTHKKWFSSVRV